MSQELIALVVANQTIKPSSELIKALPIDGSPVNVAFRLRAAKIIAGTGTMQSAINDYLVDLCFAIHTHNASFHLITEFYNALGKGVNKKAIKDWLVANTPLVWNEKEQMFKRSKKIKWTNETLEALQDQSYFEFVKAGKVKTETVTPFSPAKKLLATIKALQKLQLEAKAAGCELVSLANAIADMKVEYDYIHTNEQA